MTLRVHNIQRFCLDDGPGIRTTVFLQGCPLRCWWCQNPATRSSDGATEWTAAELAEALERDCRFFATSAGGVTVSGGEPLAQAGPLARLLAELGRRGIHRTVDTSGAAAREAVACVAPHADLWLWDVKHVDPERYREATGGGDAALALGNLAWLLGQADATVRIRVPLIAGMNADAASLAAIARHLAALPRRASVELLPGHDIRPGRSSRNAAATHGASARVTPEQLDVARRTMRDAGIQLLESRS